MSSVAPEEDAEATARLERIVFSFLKKKNFKEAAKALAQQSKVLNFKDDEDDEDGAEEIAITNQLAAIVGFVKVPGVAVLMIKRSKQYSFCPVFSGGVAALLA
eukprot:m.90330 g.90330  ORF g.90330 m.90330 type:complete len:103 (-) comp12914_c1_seq6:116-424(-)